MTRIADEHLEAWERDGYTVVEDFLNPQELEAARANLLNHFPDGEDYRQNRPRYTDPNTAFTGLVEFPFAGNVLNDNTTHPEVISFVERALGTREVHCNTGLIWAKYPGGGDYDQLLHSDLYNNTLVYPRDDGPWRHIPMILYLSDVTEDDGPTYVVSRRHTDPLDDYCPFQRSREDHPELYEHEVPITVSAGSLLIYTMKTYHRGSKMLATEGARFSHHFVYRRAGDEWMGWRSWPRHAAEPAMQSWIQQATPRQREVLGFPGPGHPYWTPETLEGVARRYPEMDMTPYREAAAPAGSAAAGQADLAS